MADAKTAAAPAETKKAAAEAPAAYYDVTLLRAVSLYGFKYKPGLTHTVNAATLELMGDAVAEKKAKG